MINSQYKREEVGGGQLHVDHEKARCKTDRAQSRHSDLGGVTAVMEHRFAEEDPSPLDAVKPSYNFV